MFTRFFKAQAVSSTHYHVHTDVDIAFPANTRQAVLQIANDNPAIAVPNIIVRHNPLGAGISFLLDSYGYVGGTYIAPMFGIPGDTYRLSWTGGARLTFTVRPQQHNTLLVNGSSIGPVSVSTKCYDASFPFTVAFTARPLFVDRVPLMTFYSGDFSTVTLADLTSILDGVPEYQAIQYAIDYKLQFELVYAVTATPGYVESVAFKTGYAAGQSVTVYSLVATVTVGIPTGGSQNLPDPIIVGAENPSNYMMREYVPSRASCNSMAFLAMQPVVLSAGRDEIQSSGRIIFERSNLYMGEAYPMRYIVTCSVLKGAGQVVISPDYAPKFTELSEYEF